MMVPLEKMAAGNPGAVDDEADMTLPHCDDKLDNAE
jgi:hypothetical protein